ncbi:MAG: transcriptional repressor [Lachnospiraceae bacterium]|nr:transcriptional repressor [Lachnospiraceae bacterium]
MTGNPEQFRELLKKNGLKVTTQRAAILEVLVDRPGMHLTAEEIYDFVKIRHPEIGLATVYRTIQLFSELGLVDKLNLDDGFVRYEISKESAPVHGHHHHHLICLDCGAVFAFQDDLLEALETRILEQTGFVVQDHEVKLYGRCEACRAMQSKAE